MKLLGKTHYCHIGDNGRVPVSKQEAIGGINMYFVSGIGDTITGKGGIPNANDIVIKNYYIVDIDIRSTIYEKEQRIISQDELLEIAERIKEKTLTSDYFHDWSMFVCSGNGLQIYYIGKKVKLEYYKLGVETLLGEFQKDILDDMGLEIDTAMKNLDRLARVPGSINDKKDKDWYIGPIECTILEKRDIESQTLTLVETLAEIKIEEIEQKKKAYQVEKKEYKSDNTNIYELIEQLNCAELFQINTKLELARDGRNFISDKDGHYISAFYSEQDNVICFESTSTRHNKYGKPVYGPYTYIKYEILNGAEDKEVYKRAKENYPHIREQDEKNREERKEKKNTKEMLYDSLGFLYPADVFTSKFGGLKSSDLVMISSGSNQGKTTFVLSILKTNKDLGKKVGVINMEFDIYDTFKFEFFRAKGYPDHELKLLGTDLRSIDENTNTQMKKYIDKRMSEIHIENMPQETTLETIVEKAYQMGKEGYSMLAIDSLSSISDVASDYKSQIKAIQTFRNFCTNTGMCIILIHHFNKGQSDFSGSSKLRDLSNVTIEIYPDCDYMGEWYRKFVLSKDKAHKQKIELNCYYRDREYVEVPPEAVGDDSAF